MNKILISLFTRQKSIRGSIKFVCFCGVDEGQIYSPCPVTNTSLHSLLPCCITLEVALIGYKPFFEINVSLFRKGTTAFKFPKCWTSLAQFLSSLGLALISALEICLNAKLDILSLY